MDERDRERFRDLTRDLARVPPLERTEDLERVSAILAEWVSVNDAGEQSRSFTQSDCDWINERTGWRRISVDPFASNESDRIRDQWKFSDDEMLPDAETRIRLVSSLFVGFLRAHYQGGSNPPVLKVCMRGSCRGFFVAPKNRRNAMFCSVACRNSTYPSHTQKKIVADRKRAKVMLQRVKDQCEFTDMDLGLEAVTDLLTRIDWDPAPTREVLFRYCALVGHKANALVNDGLAHDLTSRLCHLYGVLLYSLGPSGEHLATLGIQAASQVEGTTYPGRNATKIMTMLIEGAHAGTSDDDLVSLIRERLEESGE